MWAVLASGQSLTREQAQMCLDARLNGTLSGIIAVSNVGIDICPQADALVSHDSGWWRNHPNAYLFRGRKFCRNLMRGLEMFRPSVAGCNSGLMAMEVAFRIFHAEKILILGFDMHGTHYFGKHERGLRNTKESGFRRHLLQFDSWAGCPVINCTPDSALKKFPFLSLEQALQSVNGFES